MPHPTSSQFQTLLDGLSPELPVLIAGPTASGKSALALEIAAAQGGVVVNADASQVYDCWRVITARPSKEEEAQAPHLLYGHVAATAPYSTGHWLREVVPLLNAGQRPIIVGGTGLYFSALTQGLAEIPATPPEVRAQADELTLEVLLQGVDAATQARIDVQNRARVQRAWEVQHATGRPLADWQKQTGPAPLPLDQCFPVVFDVDKDWLNDRIARRFDLMIEQGALDEVEAVRGGYDPALPAHRAIGVPELMQYLDGNLTLDQARQNAVIATRQFAKRQRTWMRSKMANWHKINRG
ncbi:tRNA (adenosine(37)-N6)-dimethylallyltransferase MiaA [Sulfitobacter mediterraneus]|uniref:tRNA (adenosine(37)-N6)-dimethylallyltransferase MiaA n=1 Tax=Sulfitobacter mediterraneus TaxID=83219 RepID=UPI00193A656E|nr:tRNA (adenosine(37)-N6)-dimethylallyltransferase MiaA [Sulfitobacter mediterraneus]MBM1556722.1 tRNA (adenosine(37)-N6)-dimethylallyltransferase MiaA [Sulfitobacter mediterraneus]MBM1568906.1 tRNA (adenosine(37)-N6)-dimethylallyltransferase MiaA [Sulfitobacter mediterraneus]MBM1572334.1 tRNA (adenosine(37)-N6)-dimethylallyltransferase MiaA [Sulfitobacter mediterraneus]MBM1576497.1 tRNA (adenosine(37)-N6)-dimethylallyltransferase MiaA [Sulfitobacter mediterraneus]MBM1579680.1 tRNA (adenosine